jgi:hypothetical protein
MSRSVLACISTSLLAARALVAGDELPHPAVVASLELEARLAKKPAIYLVLDPQRRTIEVKSRGTALSTVALSGLEIVSQQGLFRRSLPESPMVPAIWVVKMGSGDLDREVIAPTELRPVPKDDEEEVEEASAPTPTGPTPTPTPFREPPVSYRAHLENGWDVWIVEKLPPQTRVGVFLSALRDGWDRLRGEGADHAPAITLAMRAEDARKLNHLLRSGMNILVSSGAF